MATTNFNDVVMDSNTITNTNTGSLKIGTVTLAKADSYSLATAEKNNVLIKAEMSAASKVLTLGLTEGQFAIIKNTGGTNAFTVKNIAGDTGTSLAAGKSIIVIAGSSTANTNTVIAVD